MKAAWQRLSLREQRLLLGVSAFLLIVVIFSLVWQPSRQRLAAAERQHQQQLALAAQLQRAQPRSVAAGGTDRPLSLHVSESAAAAGFELHQMETDNDVLRLTLSGEAKALLTWLDRVERDGASVQSLTLEKREAMLEARVVLK